MQFANMNTNKAKEHLPSSRGAVQEDALQVTYLQVENGRGRGVFDRIQSILEDGKMGVHLCEGVTVGISQLEQNTPCRRQGISDGCAKEQYRCGRHRVHDDPMNDVSSR